MLFILTSPWPHPRLAFLPGLLTVNSRANILRNVPSVFHRESKVECHDISEVARHYVGRGRFAESILVERY